MLREFRGDSHIAAWIGAGLDATEIGLLTELYWGLQLRTYSRTRAWTRRAVRRRHRAPRGPWPARRRRVHRHRAGVPRGHRGARPTVRWRPRCDALGDDADELFAILAPWGAAIRDAKGYPASGPHDLAGG